MWFFFLSLSLSLLPTICAPAKEETRLSHGRVMQNQWALRCRQLRRSARHKNDATHSCLSIRRFQLGWKFMAIFVDASHHGLACWWVICRFRRSQSDSYASRWLTGMACNTKSSQWKKKNESTVKGNHEKKKGHSVLCNKEEKQTTILKGLFHVLSSVQMYSSRK